MANPNSSRGRDSVAKQLAIAAEVSADLAFAKTLLPDKQASEAVKFTWKSIDVICNDVWDNRERDRGYVALNPRDKYRPFTKPHQIRRLQLLTAIRAIQKENEKAGILNRDQHYDLRCLLQVIVSSTLNHDFFWAIVALTQVLGDLSANDTISIYQEIMGDKTALVKVASAVSRKKDQIAEVLNHNFPGRLQHAEDSDKRFVRVRPTDEQLIFIKYWLQHLFPSNDIVATGLHATTNPDRVRAEGTGSMNKGTAQEREICVR